MKNSRFSRKTLAATLTSFLLFNLTLNFPFVASASGSFEGGSGTSQDPYQIATCDELQNMGLDLNAHYELISDVDCSGTTSWNSNTGFAPIGAYPNGFAGSLDGKGFRIKSLFINLPSNNNGTGVFGFAATGATIQNVEFTDPNITGGSGVGVVAGYLNEGTLTNVIVTNGTIKGTHSVGSLVGGVQITYQSSGHFVINDVAATGNTKVYGNYEMGGLFGTVYGTGLIYNSYSNADVYSTSATGNDAGGLIGHVYKGGTVDSNNTAIINYTYSTGSIGLDPGGEGDALISNVGGLVGQFDFGAAAGSLQNSFSTSVITATGTVGALVGSFQVNTPGETFLSTDYFDSSKNDGLACVSDVSVYGCQQTQGAFESDSSIWYSNHSFAPISNWDFQSNWVTTSTFPTFGISLCDQLADVNNNLSATYTLSQDLDCSLHGNDIMIGTVSPSAPYTGTFYGNGHTITINLNAAQDFVALFRNVSDAFIEDLHVKGSVSGQTGSAGIAAIASNGSVLTHVVNSADVTANGGSYAFGGIVAMLQDSSVQNSYNDGNVTLSQNLQQEGGIAGQATGTSTIINTYNKGKMIGDYSNANVGGIAGMITNQVTVANDFSVGKIVPNGILTGGVVGQLAGGSVNQLVNVYWDLGRSGTSNCAMDNNINTINATTNKCDSVNPISGSSYSAPLYFKNNNSNAPLAHWDFYDENSNPTGLWDKVVDGYPALHSIIDDGQATNDDTAPAPGDFKVTVQDGSSTPITGARVEVKCPNSSGWTTFGTTNDSGVVESNLHSTISSCQNADQNIKVRVYKLAYQINISNLSGAYYSDIDPNDEGTYHNASTNTLTVTLADVASKPSNGSGTPDDPYIIHNCAEMPLVNYDLGASYKLDTIAYGNNIGCDNEEFPLARQMSGNSLDPDFTGFFGSFDGNNTTFHYNLNHISSDNKTKYLGLFGFLNGGTFKNLHIGINITDLMQGDSDMGVVAGLAQNATIDNVTSATDINYTGTEEDTGDFAPVGFIGHDNGEGSNTVTNSTYTGTMQHVSYASSIAPKWNSVVNTTNFNDSVADLGWSDPNEVWNTQSGKLVGTGENSNFATNLLLRPTSENEVDQRIKVTFDPAAADHGNVAMGAVLRYQQNGNFYLAHINNSQIYLYSVTSGTANLLTSQNFDSILNSNHTYALDFSATTESPTFLQAHLKDLTTGRVITTVATTDSTASLQNAGQYGLTVWQIGESSGTVNATAVQTFSGSDITLSGSGSNLEDPFLINDCDDLQSLTNDVYADTTSGKYYKINATINCNDNDFLPIGFDIEGYFRGVLNGDGHDIQNLNIGTPDYGYIGLFSYLNGATISNFNLTHTMPGMNVYGSQNVGAVAGRSTGSSINMVKSDTGVNGNSTNTGGILGSADSTTIQRVKSSGTINGTGVVGGLVGGDENNGENGISQSYFTGEVVGNGENSGAGGLVGNASNLSISDSYSTGNVTGSLDGGYTNVGGILGYGTQVRVSNTYSTGNITGYNNVGGLIGYDDDDNDDDDVGMSIRNNFATSTITTGTTFDGQKAGALIGNVYDIATTNVTANYFAAANSGPGHYCISNYSTGASIWQVVDLNGCYSVSQASSFYNSANVPFTSNSTPNWNFGSDSESTWQAHPNAYPTLWAFGDQSVPDNTPPIISDVTASPDVTSAYISWNTDETSSTKVNYGLTADYDHQDQGEDGTTHVVNVTGLSSCTNYHYNVVSKDASNNRANSDDATFETTGCTTNNNNNNNNGGGSLPTNIPLQLNGGSGPTGGTNNSSNTGTNGSSTGSSSSTGNTLTNEPFTDEIGHWSHDFVLQLFNAGVVTGRAPHLYVPEGTLTRAEAVKIGLLAFGYQTDVTKPSGFTDLDPKAWYVPYIRKAKALGVISGTKFHPNDPITRSDALVMYLELAKKMDKAAPVAPFADVDQKQSYAPYVNYAYEMKVIQGRTVTNTDGSTSQIFAPSSTITRAEIAKIVVKILGLSSQV